MMTLYDVLGVRPEDDANTVKNAFRNAVKTSHPDLHADDPHAIARFRQVVRANAILSDPDQRAVYDHLLAFERWQERAKTRRGLFLSTLRNLAADAITVALLAALLGGGYLVFTHLSKTSVAAVGVTEMAAATAVEPPSRQAEKNEGGRLSREELHELITGPGPSAPPSVVAVATEAEAPAAPVATNATEPLAPATPAKDDMMVAMAAPAATGAIAQSAPVLAAAEGSGAGTARESAGEGPALAARASDAKVSDVVAGEGDAPAAEVKAIDAKASEAKSSDPKFYRERGLASYRSGDLDRALADFDQAIQLDPSSARAYIDRSIVLYRKAEFDRAFADVAQASRIQELVRAAARSHRAARN